MELRKMREKLHLTQEQLGEALGLPQPTISRWEADKLTIQHPKLLRLALAHLRCERRKRGARSGDRSRR